MDCLGQVQNTENISLPNRSFYSLSQIQTQIQTQIQKPIYPAPPLTLQLCIKTETETFTPKSKSQICISILHNLELSFSFLFVIFNCYINWFSFPSCLADCHSNLRLDPLNNITSGHDLAVLELEVPVTFSSTVSAARTASPPQVWPVCLPVAADTHLLTQGTKVPVWYQLRIHTVRSTLLASECGK